MTALHYMFAALVVLALFKLRPPSPPVVVTTRRPLAPCGACGSLACRRWGVRS